jgi:acetyl-CoA acetyltransferase
MTHPYRNVAVAGAFNTAQARQLPGHTSLSIALEAARGVLKRTGCDRMAIDGVFGEMAYEVAYALGVGPVWTPMGGAAGGIVSILDAANAIAAGQCRCALLTAGGAGLFSAGAESTAPWTRPENEFVISSGMFTAMEFALIAQRHMAVYGTRPEHLAHVAATIRNQGSINPQATFSGKGPYTIEDVLASRMIADPFHLLDCSLNAEGGAALLLVDADMAADLALPPVWLLGGCVDHMGPSYRHPPSWDLRNGGNGEIPNGYVGRRAARKAFAMSGLSPADVDTCEFYDPFSFEIIRQFEAFEFCKEGEGGDFVMEMMGLDKRYPTTTDGGLLSFGHAGGTAQLLQRVVRGVEQIQGLCVSGQVEGAEVALCSNGGAGAMFNDVLLLGKDRP